jgi:integrase
MQQWRQLAAQAVATCTSIHTRKAYTSKLTDFFRSGQPLSRDGVMAWINLRRAEMRGNPASVNAGLAAVKKLAEEAALRGLITVREHYEIRTLRCVKIPGARSGNWLTLEGQQRLRALPNRKTLPGKRNACMLALLLGCGLRRSEAVAVTWHCYQAREGRMMLVDIVGKGGRIRSVPVPEWAKQDINAWKEEVTRRGWYGKEGRILRRMRKTATGIVCDNPLTADGVWCLITRYAKAVGVENLAPHDLRRTLARLMRRSGVEWEQIQFTLGHASIATTQKYVGNLEMDEGRAGVDLVSWGMPELHPPEQYTDPSMTVREFRK